MHIPVLTENSLSSLYLSLFISLPHSLSLSLFTHRHTDTHTTILILVLLKVVKTKDNVSSIGGSRYINSGTCIWWDNYAARKKGYRDYLGKSLLLNMKAKKCVYVWERERETERESNQRMLFSVPTFEERNWVAMGIGKRHTIESSKLIHVFLKISRHYWRDY